MHVAAHCLRLVAGDALLVEQVANRLQLDAEGLGTHLSDLRGELLALLGRATTQTSGGERGAVFAHELRHTRGVIPRIVHQIEEMVDGGLEQFVVQTDGILRHGGVRHGRDGGNHLAHTAAQRAHNVLGKPREALPHLARTPHAELALHVEAHPNALSHVIGGLCHGFVALRIPLQPLNLPFHRLAPQFMLALQVPFRRLRPLEARHAIGVGTHDHLHGKMVLGRVGLCQTLDGGVEQQTVGIGHLLRRDLRAARGERRQHDVGEHQRQQHEHRGDRPQQRAHGRVVFRKSQGGGQREHQRDRDGALRAAECHHQRRMPAFLRHLAAFAGHFGMRDAQHEGDAHETHRQRHDGEQQRGGDDVTDVARQVVQGIEQDDRQLDSQQHEDGSVEREFKELPHRIGHEVHAGDVAAHATAVESDGKARRHH